MSRHGQRTFRWLTAALFVLTVAAIAFATFGAFDAIHIAVGSAIVLVMLLLAIVAWRGRLGPTTLKWSGVLAALGILQAILGSGESVPTVGLLHRLIAAVMIVASGALAHRTWTDDPAPMRSRSTAQLDNVR
jgi:heme A synthase